MTVLRQILILAGLTVLGFAIYVLLFWVGVGSSMTILFYRGVALAIVTAILVGLLAIWAARRTGDSSLPIAAAALSLSFNICFLVLLPVTVDRSVSVYLLSTIEQRQMSSAELQRAFIDGYVVKMGAIDRRIDEQRRSGNITVSPDGKVRLTAQGERFMAFSRFIARLFGTDPRFVSGGSAPAPRREAH
ncbi:MAG: hypothetical protein HOP95_05075 [Sphingomonas sp.]|nr:hypothetical protein [Sphingomonas sp.]